MKLVQQHIGIVAILGALAAFGLGSCGGDDDNNRPSTNKDGGDDSDSDSDTAGNAPYDTAHVGGVPIMPDQTGWLDAQLNTLGLQGSWYTYACDPTEGCESLTINPPLNSTFTNSGKMCFSGTAPQVIDLAIDTDTELNWSEIWGAGMAFDVCADFTDPNIKNKLGSCPTGPNLATTMLGVSVKFSGTLSPTLTEPNSELEQKVRLRIQFNEGLGVDSTYIDVTPQQIAEGTVINAYFADATVGWDPSKRPEGIQVPQIEAIQFQVPTNEISPVTWNFCVEELAALTM